MTFQNFFKNIYKKFNNKNILKLLLDLSLGDLIYSPDYNKELSYNKNEIVLFYDKTDNRFKLLRARVEIESSDTVEINRDEWEDVFDPNIEEAFLMTSIMDKNFYKYIIKFDGENDIKLPHHLLNSLVNNTLIITMNSIVITSDKYTINGDTVSFTYEHLTHLNKGTEIGFICFLPKLIPLNNRLVQVSMSQPKTFSHTITKDNIDISNNETKIYLQTDELNLIKTSSQIIIFDNGVLIAKKSYRISNNHLVLDYCVNENSIVSYIVYNTIIQYMLPGKCPNISDEQSIIMGESDNTIVTPRLFKILTDNINLPTVASSEDIENDNNNCTVTPLLINRMVRDKITELNNMPIEERAKIRISSYE